jgi:hypothetical protein
MSLKVAMGSRNTSETGHASPIIVTSGLADLVI